MSTVYVVPGVTQADFVWLRGLAKIEAPVPERCVDAKRVRTLSVERYVERRWSPREGWVVLLTPKGRDLVREFTEDDA
jgi:hypothetical protein